MRIDLLISGRGGIAREILAMLARGSLNVTAVDVAPPHIDAPAPDQGGLHALREPLRHVEGIRTEEEVFDGPHPFTARLRRCGNGCVASGLPRRLGGIFRGFRRKF